jgi:hypothetical protein
MTNLDRLNALLKDPKLNLPTFRQTVSHSFSNLSWLRAKLPKNPQASKELLDLIVLPEHRLLERRLSQ